MLTPAFPKSLLGLMRSRFPRHRFHAAMHPVITLNEYTSLISSELPERHFLCQQELAKALSFTATKRQAEWLTGRICAKLAALSYHNTITSSYFPLLPNQIEVINRETGRPAIIGALPPEMRIADLSISHGAGYGLALIADCWCGVDIQEPRQSLKKVRDKFCSIDEEELLQNNLSDLNEIQNLTLLWTAKEAAKKALSQARMPGFQELILTEAAPHIGGWMLQFLISTREFSHYPPTIIVISELYDEYAIALSLTGGGL